MDSCTAGSECSGVAACTPANLCRRCAACEVREWNCKLNASYSHVGIRRFTRQVWPHHRDNSFAPPAPAKRNTNFILSVEKLDDPKANLESPDTDAQPPRDPISGLAPAASAVPSRPH